MASDEKDKAQVIFGIDGCEASEKRLKNIFKVWCDLLGAWFNGCSGILVCVGV